MTQIKTQTLRPQIHDSSSFLLIDIKFLKLFSNEKALKTVKNVEFSKRQSLSKKWINFLLLLCDMRKMQKYFWEQNILSKV